MRLPPAGTRVMIRYRLPAGSVPPLTDVIGHLVAVEPEVRVRTKTGAVVEISPDDVVAVKALTDAPVRTSQIRAVEHAAALAWPGIEQQWLNGWLLRAAGGYTHRANSAVPLGVEANIDALPAIVDWYTRRGLTPWLAVPERLLRLPDDVPAHLETVVMVRDLPTDEPDATVRLLPRPDERWLRRYRARCSRRCADRRQRRRGGVRPYRRRRRRARCGDDRTRRSAVGGPVGGAGGRGPTTPWPCAGALLGAAGLGCRPRRDPWLHTGSGRQCRRDHALRVDGFCRSAPGALPRRS